jgi:hypothetical protein
MERPESEGADSCGAAVEGEAVIGKESMVIAEKVAITLILIMGFGLLL